jgi:hypothetical protein
MVSIGPCRPAPGAGRVFESSASVLRQATTGRLQVGRRVAVRVVSLALSLGALLPLALPAIGAEATGLGSGLAPAANVMVVSSALGAAGTVRDDQPDAYDGGLLPTLRRIIVPSIEVGLSRERPIPLGATCSCTIDRVGLVSQFDITVVRVVPDAFVMIQQLNRFNPPPSAGNRYVGVYVGQQYIAGPQDQAYTATDSDWKATATTDRLRDTQQLFHANQEYRPRADAYPGNYVNGWLFFELPIGKPAFMAWNDNFVGERGVWFALQ